MTLDGKVDFVNERACQMLEIDPEAALGRPLEDWLRLETDPDTERVRAIPTKGASDRPGDRMIEVRRTRVHLPGGCGGDPGAH